MSFVNLSFLPPIANDMIYTDHTEPIETHKSLIEAIIKQCFQQIWHETLHTKAQSAQMVYGVCNSV